MNNVSRFVNRFLRRPGVLTASRLGAPSLTGRRILGQPAPIRKGFPSHFSSSRHKPGARYLSASAATGTAAAIAAYPASLG